MWKIIVRAYFHTPAQRLVATNYRSLQVYRVIISSLDVQYIEKLGTGRKLVVSGCTQTTTLWCFYYTGRLYDWRRYFHYTHDSSSKHLPVHQPSYRGNKCFPTKDQTAWDRAADWPKGKTIQSIQGTTANWFLLLCVLQGTEIRLSLGPFFFFNAVCQRLSGSMG